MKITLLFLLFFGFTETTIAQEQCALNLKDTPGFFNLKLGMSEAEVREAFGKDLKFKPKKKNQERTFFQNFIKKPPPAILSGVRALYLRFFDHRIYQIEIFYENQPKWSTLDQFTDSLGAAKDFPNALWIFKAGEATIKCVDFSIVADQVLNPRIELTDETARAKVLKARQKPS